MDVKRCIDFNHSGVWLDADLEGTVFAGERRVLLLVMAREGHLIEQALRLRIENYIVFGDNRIVGIIIIVVFARLVFRGVIVRVTALRQRIVHILVVGTGGGGVGLSGFVIVGLDKHSFRLAFGFFAENLAVRLRSSRLDRWVVFAVGDCDGRLLGAICELLVKEQRCRADAK
jgi:hypothetical protein